MIENLILGFILTFICLVVQCIIVYILLYLFISLEKKKLLKPTFIRTTSLLIVVLTIFLAGIIVQIAIWAGMFLAFGEFENFTIAFYHSVVNFTTLGYGDLVMSEKRRLLGALEGANGVLMFGITTAFVFAILNDLLQRAWEKEVDQD